MDYIHKYSEHRKLVNKLYLAMSFVALFLFYCFSTFDVLFSLGHVWYYTGSYNFSYIVLFIVFSWLGLNLFNYITSQENNIVPSLGSLLGVFICVTCAFVSFLLQLSLFAQIFTVLTAWFLLYACLGREFAYSNLKPFTLFFLTVPFLRLFSYYEVYWISSLLTVFFDNLGMLIDSYSLKLEINNIYVIINKTYSGLRYLNVTLVLSLLYSFVNINKISYRLVYVIFSFFVAAIVNLVRVFLLILYANFYSIENMNTILPLVGWVTFLFILLVVFGTGYIIKSIAPKKKAIFIYRYNKLNDMVLGTYSRLFLSIISIVFISLAFNEFKNSYLNAMRGMPTPNAIQKLQLAENWSSCDYCALENWHPSIGKPDAKLTMTYVNSILKSKVDLYIGYYEHQYVGNSLTNLGNSFVFDKSWSLKQTNVRSFKITSLNPEQNVARVNLNKVYVNRVILDQKNSDVNRVIWYWFNINGYNTNNPVYAKYLELIDVLKTFRTHSSLIAISSEFDSYEGLMQAEDKLLIFLNDNYINLRPKPIRKAEMV